MSSTRFPLGSDTQYIINRVISEYGVERDSFQLHSVLMFLDAQFYAEYGSSATGIEWVKYGTMGMSKPSAELCYNDAMLSDLAVCDAVLEEMNWVFTSFTLVEIVNIVDRMGRTASPYSAKTAYAFDGSNVGHKLAKEALESEAEHRWLAAMLSA